MDKGSFSGRISPPGYVSITCVSTNSPIRHLDFLHQLTSGTLSQNGIPVSDVCLNRMSKIIPSPLNIVWLKRDLRTRDHASFAAAEAEGVPYLAMYLFEPSLISHPDTSERHLQFVYHSIQDMNASLKSMSNGSVLVLYGAALDVFSELSSRFDIR